MGSSRVEIGFGGSKSEEGLNGRRLGPGRDLGRIFLAFFLVSLDRYGVASEALIWFVRKEKGRLCDALDYLGGSGHYTKQFCTFEVTN
jgi:hypothetical protein